MKIAQKGRVVGLALAASVTLVVASTSISPHGRWPETWPKELEAFRSKATTLGVGMGNQENVYEIPFESREEFEAAWPGPTRYSWTPPTIKAGVLILAPCSPGTGPLLPDGTLLRSGPPGPESIKSPSGELPVYVVAENGGWVPYTTNMETNILVGFHYRARVDVMLIVDGDIVDTNRLTFPEGVKLVPGQFAVQPPGK